MRIITAIKDYPGWATLSGIGFLTALELVGYLQTGDGLMSALFGPEWLSLFVASPWFKVVALGVGIIGLWRIAHLSGQDAAREAERQACVMERETALRDAALKDAVAKLAATFEIPWLLTEYLVEDLDDYPLAHLAIKAAGSFRDYSREIHQLVGGQERLVGPLRDKLTMQRQALQNDLSALSARAEVPMPVWTPMPTIHNLSGDPMDGSMVPFKATDNKAFLESEMYLCDNVDSFLSEIDNIIEGRTQKFRSAFSKVQQNLWELKNG